jgi:hypothetical protein
MDEKDSRKHLADLAHGHHHAGEHDWDDKSTSGASKTGRAPGSGTVVKKVTPKSPAKKAHRKSEAT